MKKIELIHFSKIAFIVFARHWYDKFKYILSMLMFMLILMVKLKTVSHRLDLVSSFY